MSGRLFSRIERFRENIALIGTDGERIRYADFLRLSDELSAPIGSQRSLVLCEIANEVEPIAFYVGALRAGHVVIPTSTGNLADNIAGTFMPGARFSKSGANWSLEKAGHRVPLHPDLAVLLSTSGSTGSPKLVRLSHANLVSNALSIAEYLGFQPGERAITSLPPYYSYGLSVIHSHLHCGHCIVLNDHSLAEREFWDIVEREQVTSFAGVPHSFELLDRAGFSIGDHPSLRYFTQAGGKLAADRVRELARQAREASKRFYVMYGQTEAGPRMAFLPPEHALECAGAIGRAIPGGAFHLEPIEDPDGSNPGEGELIYRGPNVMMGYAHSPEDLIKPQGTDILRTGDIATRDSSGYYRIIGRMGRFAKLFGLRISYDEIERRLESAGTSAAVAGDDGGIVVAALAPSDPEVLEVTLSQDLGLLRGMITVVEIDEFPRLPTGKIDYPAIRNRGQHSAGSASAASSTKGLATSIAKILGRADIDTKQSFASLGGDSLNYIQVSLAVEDFLGYLPADWENVPIVALERMPRKSSERSRGAGRQLSILGYDAARSVAMMLALLAHCLVQTRASLGPLGDFCMRLATPTLIILFGIMIAFLHQPKMEVGGIRKSLEDNLKVSLQCYALFALNVLAFWATDISSWKYALLSLSMLGSLKYAQILSFYAVMFAVLPLLTAIIRRYNFYLIFACSLVIHMLFPLLKSIPSPPEINGQPMIQRVLDLLVGTGSAPILAGPSFAHGLVLVFAGYWIGLAARNSSGKEAYLRTFLRPQLVILAVFAAMAISSLFIPGYPVTFEALGHMRLRNLNHPAYIFIVGGASLLILDAILIMPWVRRIPPWFMVPGRNSLFAFGFGNILIILWPRDGLAVLSPPVNALLLYASVMALIYAYDYCMGHGSSGKGLPALVYSLSRSARHATRGIAEWIVREGSQFVARTHRRLDRAHI